MKKAPPWWQLPAIVGGIVLALGAIGTGIVKLAKFLTVTDRVEAVEQVNAQQEKVLDRLTYVIERQQQLMEQREPPRQEWRDPETGQWWCCDQMQCADEQWYLC